MSEGRPVKEVGEEQFLFDVEADRLHEECGVAGIMLTEPDAVAEYLVYGLQALQHRGQEAAGIAVGKPEATMVIKDNGLVSDVLGGGVVRGMPKSYTGLGHVRYGTVTVGTSGLLEAAGPMLTSVPGSDKSIALSHNGNLVNTPELCDVFGVDYRDDVTDSYLVTNCIATAREKTETLPDAVADVCKRAEGAFSLCIMGEDQLVGARDPYGFRPLWLGSYKGGGYAIASEQPAIIAMGAVPRREVAPGEMIVCEKDGSMTSWFPFAPKPPRFCALEYVYFASPNGELMNRSVQMVRKRCGEILAREHPTLTDVVIGMPESALPSAEAYAQALGIPKVSGIVKARYLADADRSFIMPGQTKRELAVHRKAQIIGPEVYDRTITLVDDSIVRGTTMRIAVQLLRDAGAREVHVRISSPPVKWPCFFGMDMGNPAELVANQMPKLNKLREFIGADSLEFLSVRGLREAAADAAGKLCMACMTGDYPTSSPVLLQLGLPPATNR